MRVFLPYQPLEAITRRGSELVEVVVDGQTMGIPKMQAGCLSGIFGWGDNHLEGDLEVDFLKILHHPWPLYLVTVARHLVLQAEAPLGKNSDSMLFRYILPREPHLVLSSHPFPVSFIDRPTWPLDTDRSGISRLHAIAYCILSGACSPDEARHWLHGNARLIVQCLQHLRHARLFVPHSRYLTKHSYLHDVSLLLGILLKAAGEEFMVTLALCGGQQFLQEVGLT